MVRDGVRVRVLLAFSCLPIVCSANPQSAFYPWPVIERYDTNCSYLYTLVKFDEHIDIKINKAYQMLGIIKRNFIYLTPHGFVILYKALVHSHLEHAVCVWSPHHKLLIEKLEKYKKGPRN